MGGLELDPLVHSNDLLVAVSVHRYTASKEEQWEGRDHGGVVQEHGRALDLGVVDEELVVKRSLVTVDRLWVELDFVILCEQLRWSAGTDTVEDKKQVEIHV